MTRTYRTTTTMAPATVFLSTLLILLTGVASEFDEKEKQALLTFINSTQHMPGYNWNSSLPVCSGEWKGVTCDPTMTTVMFLKIPGALMGEIPPNTIGILTNLRILSLRDNRLRGTIPSDFSNLISLTRLYLFNNSFSGKLPEINAKELTKFNVSYNNLSTSIPSSFSRFPKSAFSNNVYLCGHPFQHCNSTYSSPPPSLAKQRANENRSDKRLIVGISIGSGITLLILLCCLRKKMYSNQRSTTTNTKLQMEAPVPEERMTLVMFDDGDPSCRFCLDDLLKASAEILGRGRFGTTYKVVIEEDKMVVLKRLKDVVVAENVFESVMEVLGRVKNGNLVLLKGYYCVGDEKFLVYDYMPGGSLFAFLHGSRRTQLSWENRTRIALGVARGLTHLHAFEKIVHGNIKSSNILIQEERNVDGLVSDYGLSTLFDWSTYQDYEDTGYMAPEVLDTREVTFESDVYSFGVLLLELLTGENPNQASLSKEWFPSRLHEEHDAEIFDANIRTDQNIDEMVQLLRIAKYCVSDVPDQRQKMHDVVSMMEVMWSRQSVDDFSKIYEDTPSTETRDTPSTSTITP